MPELASYFKYTREVKKKMTDIFLEDFVALVGAGLKKAGGKLKDFANKKRKAHRRNKNKKLTKAQKKEKRMVKAQVDASAKHHEKMAKMKENIRGA